MRDVRAAVGRGGEGRPGAGGVAAVAAVKALACGSCGDIQALQEEWRACVCGKTEARWVDARKGTAEFKDPGPHDRRYCFLLGLNNHLLVPALRGELAMFQDFRAAHERATHAPGYIFDREKADCWAVVVRVGQTSDVTWAGPAEAEPPPDLSDSLE